MNLRAKAQGQRCVRCNRDDEAWIPVVGFEGRYEVSNLGRVRAIQRLSIRRGFPYLKAAKTLTPGLAGRGPYEQVHLYRDGKRFPVYVHQAVLMAFVGPRPGPGYEACHGPNGMRDNSLRNLRWDTRLANVTDSVTNGAQKGERNPRSKLKESDVARIRALRARGAAARDIASEFGVSVDYIYSIVNRARWRHI